MRHDGNEILEQGGVRARTVAEQRNYLNVRQQKDINRYKQYGQGT